MIRVAGSVMVVVKPGAKAPGIVTGDGGVIVVRVRERAVDGKANEAVRASLALALDVPKSAVALVRGATARLKAFSVDGLTDEQIRVRLAQVKK